jgi:hypothetical protein
VVQHTGRMQSGHYTAFVKDTAVPAKGKSSEAVRWFHVSDERCVLSRLTNLLLMFAEDVNLAHDDATYLHTSGFFLSTFVFFALVYKKETLS